MKPVWFSVGAAAALLAGTVGFVAINGPVGSKPDETAASRAPDTPQARRIATGYARLKRDLAEHFWGSDHPADLHRAAPPRPAGMPDLLADTAPMPAIWQTAQYTKLIVGEWRIERSVEARHRLVADWANLRALYGPAELSSDGARDGTIATSGDAAWKANYLAQLHEVTGDRKILYYLMEMIPAVLARFEDPNQRRLMHGTSPRGRPLRSSRYGMLLHESGSPAATPGGRVSTLHEVMFALAALYVAEETGDSGYRRYAETTWSWVKANLRNQKDHDGDGATGLYLSELLLDPALMMNGRPVARKSPIGPPMRGNSAQYDGGTLAMAVLSARLYRATRDPAYLEEAKAIAGAYAGPDAFLRTIGGRPLFVDARDPWTNGYWFPDFVRHVLPLPGLDPDHRFAIALRNTAESILRQRTPDGYYGADWSGPELNIANRTRSWIQEARLDGARALPQQMMTSANAAMVVQAAFALDR